MKSLSLRRLLVFLFFCLPLLLFSQKKRLPRRTDLPAELKEVSGMTRLPNGDLWLLNDSHNPADLFRFDPIAGKLLEVRHLPVQNFDWEDLTHDSAGNLYIGDFGNNFNSRKDLIIYKFNPKQPDSTEKIMFNYDVTTSSLNTYSAYRSAYEVSLVWKGIYNFMSKNERSVQCAAPKF